MIFPPRFTTLAAVLLVACDSSPPERPDAGTPTSDAAPDAAGPVAAPDLGEGCPMGCNLTLCADTMSSSCSTEICVWDGRFGIDAYCSQSCATAGCPDGYTCLASDDDEGSFCFANPAACGNGILERGEVCDPGGTVGTPASGCAAGCEATLGGGSVTWLWDGTPIALEGTSTTGDRVSSEVNATFVTAHWNGGDLSLGLRVAVADLVGPFPKVVQSQLSITYTFEAWCFDLPANGLGPVITVEEWSGGYHLVGTFDGTAQYGRCCSTCVDPAVRSHAITGSRFDVFIEK